MVYAIPREDLHETDGHGVILEIEWYREDPKEKRNAAVDFLDQTTIYADSTEDVTDDMILEAVARRLPNAEAELAPKREPSASARQVLGQVFDASELVAEVEQRRAAKAVERG